MEYRLTSGTKTLELAAALAVTSGAFANLSVDGAFLVFTLPGTAVEAKAAVTEIADAVVSLRDEANEAGETYEAHTTLINTAMGVLRDIDRDFAPRATVAVTPVASDTEQESQPTGSNDSAITNASTQSSVEPNNQEHGNEAQFEEQSSKASGRNVRK